MTGHPHLDDWAAILSHWESKWVPSLYNKNALRLLTATRND